jgi:signal transduction histidine kinase
MLLSQYLDNACKYADFGSTVTVRAERSGDEVLFSVHSIGPVIPVADRERIFDRFYRSACTSRRAPGTGIGLSIAKRVALVHHGAVWVASDETQGNTFFAAIPCAQQNSRASASEGCAIPHSTDSKTQLIDSAQLSEFERTAP